MKISTLFLALSIILITGCKGNFNAMNGTAFATRGHGVAIPVTNRARPVHGTPCTYVVEPTGIAFSTYEEALDWKSSAWRTGLQRDTIVEHCAGRKTAYRSFR